MLELRDRELHLYVEATWPQYFTNILQQTLQTLITDTWPGLKDRYYFAVPCASKEGNRPCSGRFKIDILMQFHREGDVNHRCHICGARYKIEDLLYGFEDKSPNEQLDRIEKKVDQGLLQSVELKSLIANYTMGIMRAIANEAKNGPRLFTLEPVDGNWRRPFNKRYRLYLWCEKENEQHPVYQPEQGIHAGMYELEVSRDWLIQVAPYANLVSRVLKTVLPVAIPAANLYFGEDIMDDWTISQSLDAMKEGTGNLLESELKTSESDRFKDGLLSDAERSGILALHSFLREEDPHHKNLGLKRMPTYTGDYLWLRNKHYQEAQSIIPDRIE